MKPLHRDDLPYEVVEEIEKVFAQTHPDKKVVFLGDQQTDMDAGFVLQMLNDFEALMTSRMEERRCWSCGRQMPDDPDGLPEGWGVIHEVSATGESGTPCGFECPNCDQDVDLENMVIDTGDKDE